MDKKGLKTIFIFLFVGLPFILNSQNIHTRITSDERKQLEEKFKDLKTFRIDDDGTVVFRYVGEDNKKQEEHQVADTPQSVIKVRVGMNEDGEYTVTTEEVEPTETEEVIDSNEYPLFDEPEFVIEDKDIPQIIIDKKEVNQEQEVIIEKKNEPVIIEDKTYVGEEPAMEEAKEETLTDSIDNQEDNSVRKDVFKKKEPVYKTLEEAAMAVDDLLNKLKQQQEQSGNRKRSSSLSQKMARGVDGSLRKDVPSLPAKETIILDNEDEYEGETPDYGDEPTYYINGVRSTKAEFDKLKSNQILSKKIKRSRNNPNGEWWIETM